MRRQRASRQRIVVAMVGALVTGHFLRVSPVAAAESAKPAAAPRPAGGASGLKIGYVNLGEVFDGYQRTKQSEQTLEQRSQKIQGELEGRVGELKKLRQGLELLNDQARETKAREIEEKSDEFQRAKIRTERELLRDRNEAAREILKEIQQTVTEYAKSRGFSIIVDQRSLIYGENALDVTDEVLKALNERYAARAKP